MDNQKHIERHKELHKCLDELVADFATHSGKMLSLSTVIDLIQWSKKQTENPTGDY